jgi:hypothetical protein
MPSRLLRPWWVRLLASLAAGFGTAILAAIALAVVDLYLSGHGLRPLTTPWVEWPAGGIYLSRADVILLGAVLVAVVITWRQAATGAQ